MCKCVVNVQLKFLSHYYIYTFSHLHISYSPAFLILPTYMSLENSIFALANWALKASLA